MHDVPNSHINLRLEVSHKLKLALSNGFVNTKNIKNKFLKGSRDHNKK